MVRLTRYPIYVWYMPTSLVRTDLLATAFVWYLPVTLVLADLLATLYVWYLPTIILYKQTY